MELSFYIDPETSLPHIYVHGVTEVEVHEAMLRRIEDRRGAEGSRVLIGRTAAGRILRVIYAPARDTNGWFIITAYDVRGNALAALRRRQRRRGQ